MKKRNSTAQLVMCIDNEGYYPDLELRKVYRAIPDSDAARHREIRVIDESGEDYIFPSTCFVSVEILRADEKKKAARLLAASG